MITLQHVGLAANYSVQDGLPAVVVCLAAFAAMLHALKKKQAGTFD